MGKRRAAWAFPIGRAFSVMFLVPESLLQPLGDDGVDTLASTSSGRAIPGRASRDRLRSAAWRTVIPSSPHARAMAAKSVSGNWTMSTACQDLEMVDLGAVGGVVVHDDEHVQAEASHRLELGQGHQEPAVPERSTVKRSGRATAAPIAVARPRPIDW